MKHLLGIPQNLGVDIVVSVSQSVLISTCVHEPRKYIQMNHQIRPDKYSAEAVGLHCTGLKALHLHELESLRKIPESIEISESLIDGCLTYLKQKGPGKIPTVDSRGQAEHRSYCFLPFRGDGEEYNRYRGINNRLAHSLHWLPRKTSRRQISLLSPSG